MSTKLAPTFCEECGSDQFALCRSVAAAWWQCEKCLNDQAVAEAPPTDEELAGLRDDAFCPRCGSFEIENVDHGDDWAASHNFCRACERTSDYIPTMATVARAAQELIGRNDHAQLTAELIAKVKQTSGSAHVVARDLGVSYSVVLKIRRGTYEHDGEHYVQGIGYCQVCERRVTWPCVACETRRAIVRERPHAPLYHYAHDPRLAARAAAPLATIGLHARTLSVLENGRFFYVSQYLAATDDDLALVGGLGTITVRQIDGMLARIGLARNRSDKVDEYRKPKMRVYRRRNSYALAVGAPT